jgi:hypothetical protein
MLEPGTISLELPEVKNRKLARQKGQDGMQRYLPFFLVCTYLLLGARFFGLIRQYAVNVLYWDQWDLDDAALFQRHSIWEMFRWQHNWQRMGLGGPLQKLIEPWIHWNGRDDAFLLGAGIVGVAVLALLLKVRLYGGIGYSDVIIPLLFLTPLQYETLVLADSPVFFLLLLPVLYCSCWLIRAYRWKYVCVLLMNFFLIYSGSGIFIGLVTPVLLALDYYGNTRHLAPRYRWGSAAALAISIASLASFFVRYKFNPAVDCFSPAPRNPIGYLWFVALMLAHVAGLTVVRLTLATLIGSIALLLLLVGLALAAKGLLAQNSDTWSRDAAIAALLAYCAVYCLSTAYGRLCSGLIAAFSSRYTFYVVLGFFGLYLYALSIRSRNLRVSLVLVLLVYAVLGALPLNRVDALNLAYLSNGKRAWRECYLARHDIHECDTLTHFPIYPNPEATRLQEKLDFLERNHLNLYDNSK